VLNGGQRARGQRDLTHVKRGGGYGGRAGRAEDARSSSLRISPTPSSKTKVTDEKSIRARVNKQAAQHCVASAGLRGQRWFAIGQSVFSWLAIWQQDGSAGLSGVWAQTRWIGTMRTNPKRAFSARRRSFVLTSLDCSKLQAGGNPAGHRLRRFCATDGPRIC
jgi:hypothetical protein